MKRVLAELLRKRSAWQLVAIAALCSIVGLYIIYTSYSSTLRKLQSVLVLLFGIGGAALILALVRRAEDLKGVADAGRRWLVFLAAIVGLAGAVAFVTYSFGHHARDMVARCEAARLPETLAERQAALAGAEADLRSPFALLPGLLDDEAARSCEESRLDLARVDQGLCTRWVLVGQACACGDERYPYARCPEPRCLYAAGLPDRFDCPGDPILEGYY